jgi:hypothetical protein
MNANDILLETAHELGSIDIEQLPQLLAKFKSEIAQMEKDL